MRLFRQIYRCSQIVGLWALLLINPLTHALPPHMLFPPVPFEKRHSLFYQFCINYDQKFKKDPSYGPETQSLLKDLMVDWLSLRSKTREPVESLLTPLVSQNPNPTLLLQIQSVLHTVKEEEQKKKAFKKDKAERRQAIILPLEEKEESAQASPRFPLFNILEESHENSSRASTFTPSPFTQHGFGFTTPVKRKAPLLPNPLPPLENLQRPGRYPTEKPNQENINKGLNPKHLKEKMASSLPKEKEKPRTDTIPEPHKSCVVVKKKWRF